MTLSAVPTGTVDLLTTIRSCVIHFPISAAADNTYCMSALPSSPIGVPTARKQILEFFKPSSKFVEKDRLPILLFLDTSTSRPGS